MHLLTYLLTAFTRRFGADRMLQWFCFIGRVCADPKRYATRLQYVTERTARRDRTRNIDHCCSSKFITAINYGGGGYKLRISVATSGSDALSADSWASAYRGEWGQLTPPRKKDEN